VTIRAAERFVASGQDWDGFPVYVVTATEGSGAGGALRVDARDVVVSGAFLDSVAQGAGNGGALTITAETIRVESGGGYVGSVGSLSGAFATGPAGPVTLRASQSITVDGTGFNWLSGAFGPTQVLSQNVGPGAGGTVLLESPRVVLDRGAWVIAQGYGTGDVGSVVIRPHDLVLRGGATIGSSRATDATGRSGGVRIEGTGRLTLGSPAPPGTTMAPTDGDSIITSDAGPGAAGDITIDMAEVHLGLGTAITSLAAGTGDSGNITINAQRMRATAALINSSTQPTSAAPGATTRPSRAGAITLNLGESLEMSMLLRAGNGVTGGVSSVSNGSGAAGDISISAPSIVLDEVVVQAAVSGAGRGGRIAVRANDLIMRNGAQLVTGTEATASGAAGSIDLAVAGRLEISGQRRLDGVDAGLSATTRGTGAGGDITIAAGQLAIGGRGFISSSTEGPGNAGSIAIRANTIDLAEGAAIRARSSGPGTAGAIRIAATDALRIFGDSTISAEALSSDGGNIDIRVGNLVHLRRSEITTAVGSGQGAGGNIFIDPTFVILEDGSRIVANAFGGSGGNIRIIAAYFLNTLDTLVDASSQLGVPGTVSIAAPNNNLSTQIKVLPATFFDASQLVREACSSRYASGRGGSSLVGVGRGGLAASPERFAASTYFGDAAAAVASASNGAGVKLTATKQARRQGDCAS
jgi:large exoprotein involved in heme utilization and adhesion